MSNFIISLLCVISCILVLIKMKKINKLYIEKREPFVSYLDEINDLETLKRIGEINIFDQREKWVPKYSYVKKWLEYKIDETKDENYIAFYKDYRHFVFSMALYSPVLLFSIGIPVSIILSFF